MKTDEALRDAIRTALDRRLSGVTERPDSRQRMLRLICKEETIVKKKVSTGLVLVIALVLATMSAALATGGFGLLDYKREQARNEAFTERIVTVGERFENDDLTLTVNEAVFNGMTLAFTLDLAARDASRPVYVIPTLTAEADGRTWTVEPEAASGEFSADGFWAPCMDPRQEPTTQFGVEAALIGAEDGPALPEGEVTWRLSLRILRPNYPIAYAEAALPADDAAMTDELTEGSEALFAQADERTKGFSLFRAIRAMNGGEFVPSPPDRDDFISDENLFRYQARVIQTLCDTEDCVIVGRCGDYILRERENVLKLFVHAPMDVRIDVVRDVDGLNASEAERRIRRIDKRRAEYYRCFTGQDWQDARNYDLCLNTGRMSWEQCRDLVRACMRIRFEDFGN